MAPQGKLSSKSDEEDKLEWIRLNEFLDEEGHGQEQMKQKIIRKTKENPLVPIGVLATVAALTWGLRSMKTGDKRMSQLMMRARVIAQGFTFAAIMVGVGLAAWKQQSKTKVAAPVVVQNDQ